MLLAGREEWLGRLALGALALLCFLFAPLAHGAQERYDYDALGRSIRVIDEQGRVTEYVYDAATPLNETIASTAALGRSSSMLVGSSLTSPLIQLHIS